MSAALAGRIIQAGVDFSGATPDVFLGRTKTRALVMARMTCYALVRERTHLSYPEIGRLFGRDHTTVLTGVRVARVMRMRSRHWAECFEAIECALLDWREERTIETLELGA